MSTDRLSALDAVFLPMETDTQSLHVGSVLVLAGPAPDPTAFREHIAQRLAGVPAHRRRVQRMPLDLGRPIWADTQVDLAAHVRRTVLDAPGDQAQLRSLVARVMAPRLDVDRPLWQLWQIDGLAGGRWAVIAKVHHTMVDGRAGTDVLGCLLTGEPPAPAPAEVMDPRPAPAPIDLMRDLLTWLTLLPVRTVRLGVRALLAPREACRRIRRLRFGLAQVLRPDLPPSVLTGPLGPRRTWGWTGADLAATVRVARAAGGTVNDVFLAALAGGYRRYLRDRGEPLDAMVLRAIVPVSQRAPGRACRAGQGRVNVVASNVPGPPSVRHLAGRRVLEMAPYVPVAQEIRACAAMVSYAGRLTVGITADADALPDADALVAAVGRELGDLLGASSGP